MESEQETTLEETLRSVKSHAFEMKRSLDKKEIKDGLRHVNNMLNELRNTNLGPKFYYRLYIDVTNELQHFLVYLTDEYVDGGVNKISELYEYVQFAVNIIPRLYLMITVGVAYIKSKEAPCKDVLRDMVEMCRGVQHPLKGLFLRNYLLTCTKELLPVCAPGENDENGNVNDSLDIVMTNFSEMNKLWVRMQHQGPSREKEKRERERRELRILIGTNLVRLSQLELLDLDMYRNTVLPGILEQAVSCKEAISQEYLMECVIQVFPDEFHLATLSEFLGACVGLQPTVQIKNVLCAVIDRLTAFAVQENNPELPKQYRLFEVFSEHCEQVISARDEMLPEDIVTIQRALVNLALKCYSSKTEYANTVFESTALIFERLGQKNILPNTNVGKELIKLLKLPIESCSNCLALLELESYKKVLSVLGYRGRAQVCLAIVRAMMENDVYVDDEVKLEKLFTLLDTLLVDQDDQPQDLAKNEDFVEEQELAACLVHLIKHPDPEIHLKLLHKARKAFGKGGPSRLKYTLPPLVLAWFSILPTYANSIVGQEGSAHRIRKLFQTCQSTIVALKDETDSHELSLSLFLQGALIADKTKFEEAETVTYEFASSAFTIFEEDLTEARAQVHCLNQLAGTVLQLVNLPDENHETLRNQCAMYALRLLRKAEQARALCQVAHVFWKSRVPQKETQLRDGKRVAECLKKALKVTSQCMEDMVQLGLYVHLLSNYVYFYEQGCDTIHSAVISQIVDKVRDSLSQVDPCAQAEQLTDTFNAVLAQVRTLKRSDSEDLAKLLDTLST